MARKTSSNVFFLRCDRFRQVFVQIGVILAIFRPFEFSVLFESLSLADFSPARSRSLAKDIWITVDEGESWMRVWDVDASGGWAARAYFSATLLRFEGEADRILILGGTKRYGEDATHEDAWLGSFDYALPFVGLIGTWVMFGFTMILFIAGVQKIPSELYDAAKVDGAGAFAEFFNVTLPGLKGEIIVALVFTVTLALRNFDLIYITTGGGPGTSTMIPSMFIYKKAFQMNQVGSASSL